MTHTPGPWHVYGDRKTTIWSMSAEATQVAACVNKIDRSDLARAQANARLIAAAPELLEALRNLADDVKGVALNTYATTAGDFYDAWKEEDPDGFRFWNAAQEALAKAED